MFLTTLFPSNQLQIMDYNRVVKDLAGLDVPTLLERIGQKFTIEKVDKAFSPAQLHEFGLYVANQWYKLGAKDGTFSGDPIGILDVTILQENILDPILGIKDQRTDKRIDFVGGIRGPVELKRLVEGGKAAVAFAMYPTTIDDLVAIGEAGGIMEPKSSWFEQKQRDGLRTHLI